VPSGRHPVLLVVAPTMSHVFGTRIHRSGAEYVVELSGVLNRATIQALATVLEEALETDAGRIVLDLSELEAIDRAGVYTILLAHLRAADQLRQLLIVPGPPVVQHVFDAVQGPFSYYGE
jgi:anti-anti-sigma factor